MSPTSRSRLGCAILELNANESLVQQTLGWIEMAYRHPEPCTDRLLRMQRANPRRPWTYNAHAMLSAGYCLAKNYAKGLEWGLRAASEAPNLVHVDLMVAATSV